MTGFFYCILVSSLNGKSMCLIHTREWDRYPRHQLKIKNRKEKNEKLKLNCRCSFRRVDYIIHGNGLTQE